MTKELQTHHTRVKPQRKLCYFKYTCASTPVRRLLILITTATIININNTVNTKKKLHVVLITPNNHCYYDNIDLEGK